MKKLLHMFRRNSKARILVDMHIVICEILEQDATKY